MANCSGDFLILALDTATTRGSAALARGFDLVGCRTWSGKNESHSSRALCEIDALLRERNIPLKSIDLFAASCGPGSFTGLRIGLATVKGFAATLNKPCSGIPTLHTIARAAGPSAMTMVCLPAGRGELYSQLLQVKEDGTITELSDAVHAAPEELLRSVRRGGDGGGDGGGVSESLVWAGAGADVYSERIIEFALENRIAVQRRGKFIESGSTAGLTPTRTWVLAEAPAEEEEEPLAVHTAALAWREFTAGRASTAAELQAIYVRRAEAEVRAGSCSD